MVYTNKNINLISIFITIIIFIIIDFVFFNSEVDSVDDKVSNLISTIKNEDEIGIEEDKNQNKDEKKIELGNWYIEIPKINLIAPIAEGTESETLNTKVGHFENTSETLGNIGLAAHNRGYEYNYFENLKKLNIDDEIIYNYKDFKKRYNIDKIEIIKNTDWSYLDSSDENKITLITCIENEPQYRRCVQATELEI